MKLTSELLTNQIKKQKCVLLQLTQIASEAEEGGGGGGAGDTHLVDPLQARNGAGLNHLDQPRPHPHPVHRHVGLKRGHKRSHEQRASYRDTRASSDEVELEWQEVEEE